MPYEATSRHGCLIDSIIIKTEFYGKAQAFPFSYLTHLFFVTITHLLIWTILSGCSQRQLQSLTTTNWIQFGQMLKKIKNLFSSSGQGSQAPHTSAKRIPASEHGINQHSISHSALKVISELQRSGFEAYLVGGGVRDLLLGETPKDFDVATDATPEQVQNVFRRARIIGRRFRIVHVRMGREVLEVTTFRGSHQQQSVGRGPAKKQAVQNNKGMLLRDNVYGDLVSDAYRRDFTVNALYYDPSTEEIIDQTGGVAHLRAKRLHIIGNANDRYKEDPVRMLRAVRFKCKLGFELDPDTESPIKKHADYLGDIPSARLFEEVLKLFMSGKAVSLLTELHHYHLLQYLFPATAEVLDGDNDISKRLITTAAENTDKRLAQGKRVTPAFIYAAFLWPSLQQEIALLRQNSRAGDQELLFKAADSVIAVQLQRTAVPKRFLIPMKEIWTLQLRFSRRDPKRAFALLEHKRFRAAYDFLLLRESSGELSDSSLGDWWTLFQEADQDQQTAMLGDVKSTRPKRSHRSRRRKKPQGAE